MAGRGFRLGALSGGGELVRFYRGERGLYARRLVAAAREARTGRRGLWGACPRARLIPERQVETGPP